MIKYLIVLIDPAAPSFCYYKTEPADGTTGSAGRKPSGLMSESDLKKITTYAQEKNLIINFLLGKDPLPGKHAALIEKTAHIKMFPAESGSTYGQGIHIIDKNNRKDVLDLWTGKNTPGDGGAGAEDLQRNIILRLEKHEIKNCALLIKQLLGKFKRLNLNLIDIPHFEEKDIALYRKQLEIIADMLITEYKNGNAYECNILSDRILLRQMQNCNAGIDHITFAPDGRFYLCPGFYYTGDSHGIEYDEDACVIKEDSILTLGNAPICSLCDCYQCKRCLYLNKQATMQLNTPSYQQCVLSHHERNTSREILAALHKMKDFKDLNHIPPIPEIDYIDPFELITRETKTDKQKMPQLKTVPLDTQTKKQKPGEKKNIKSNTGESGIKKKRMNQVQGKMNNDRITGTPAGMMNLEEFKKLSTKEMLIELFKMQQKILKEYTIRDGS
jgi:CXXX repeat peptide maturase